MRALRDNLLLANFCLLLLLGFGYMHLRVPQAQIGVPISEWLLLLTILTIRPLVVLGHMRGQHILLPSLLWITYGAIIIVMSYLDHGIRAVRDGLPVIEASFLFAGFVFAGHPDSIRKLAKWLPRLFVAGFFYILLYPLHWLDDFSPQITGMQGQPVNVLFQFWTLPLVLIVAVAYLLEQYQRKSDWRLLVAAAMAIAVTLILMPSRSLLIMIFVLVSYFVVIGSVRTSLGLAWLVGLGAVFTVVLLSIGIEGTRLGITDLSQYKSLFMEIFPGTETTLSSGTSRRLEWWLSIYQQLTSSWQNLLFGLGYGVPLTDLRLVHDVVVYSPHNTLIGVFARGGLIAGFVFIWLHVIIVRCAFRVVHRYRNSGRDASIVVSLLFIILNTLVLSIGESPFTVPVHAVPYYLSAGILIRLNRDFPPVGTESRAGV